MEGNGGFDAFDHIFTERTVHGLNGFLAGLGHRDQLSDHRIIVGRNDVSGIGVAVDPYAMATGLMQHRNTAGRGTKIVVRVLRIDPTLDRVHLRNIITTRNFIPRRNQDLLLDEIVIDHLLRHTMLHLNPRVHFHEIEVPVLVHQKLNRTYTLIIDRRRRLLGRLPHLESQLIGHER